MTTAIATNRTTGGVINRTESPAAGVGAASGRPPRPAALTSRDIEAEALARLARRGYDWSFRPGKLRKAS